MPNPYKGEIPITSYFSRTLAGTTPKPSQPRLKKRKSLVAEDRLVAEGTAKEPSPKKLKVKDGLTTKPQARSHSALKVRSNAEPGPSTSTSSLSILPGLVARQGSGTSGMPDSPIDVDSEAPHLFAHTSASAQETELFKPPSLRISASQRVIQEVASQEDRDIRREEEADIGLSRRSSEDSVPSSQTQELDYDFGASLQWQSSGLIEREPLVQLQQPSTDTASTSRRITSTRKIMFTDTLETIPPPDTHPNASEESDFVESSQTQHMAFEGLPSPVPSIEELEVIPSSQSQWDPSVEVSEDLLGDTTLTIQSADEFDLCGSIMRRSESPLPNSSQTQPEDPEDEAPRSRSRSPDLRGQFRLQESQASMYDDVSGPKPGYSPTEHTPSSPLRFTQSFPLTQDGSSYSQADCGGSSLPSVVKDFRDMFDDEGSYPIDFPMSLRI